MGAVHNFPGKGRVVADGAGGGDDGGMEARLKRIEDTLPTLATKDELKLGFAELRTEMHKGFSDQIKWIVGSSLAMAAAGITVLTFVLNNATPKVPAAAPQPTIIVLPAQPAPTASVPAP